MFAHSPNKRRWSWNRPLQCGLIVALVAAGAALAPAPSASAGPVACDQLFIVGARGSAEAQDNQGGFGFVVGPFVEQLRQQLPPAYTVSSEAVVYPAAPVPGWDLINATHNYDGSVLAGVVNAQNIIQRQAAACPDQKFVLVGYSQGADVIGQTIALVPDLRPRIASVALFGDPQFNPADVASRRGTATERIGISGFARQIPSDLIGRVTSSCFADDGVCQGGLRLDLGIPAHLSYVERGQVAAIVPETSAQIINYVPLPQRATGPQGDRLQPGQFLLRGDYLESADGAFRMVLQPDGNLATYRISDNALIWTAGVAGGTKAVMQPDGSFVVDNAGAVVWVDPFRKSVVLNTSVVLQPDGNAVGYAPDGQVAFATSYNQQGLAEKAGVEAEVLRQAEINHTTLQPGRQLNVGDAIESPNRAFVLAMQPDGNAVMYRKSDGVALWASNTAGQGQFLAMQTDGNLVLYGAGGSVGWSSHSPGAGPSHAAVQDDGNFVIYAADGRVVWASNTNEGRINIGGDKPRSGGGGWDFLSILIPFINFGGGGGGCQVEVGC
jgi:Cutinase